MGKEPEELGGEWVELLVTCDEFQADMIRDILLSGDIPAIIRSSRVTPYPVHIGKLGELRVFVRAGDLTMAKAVVASYTPTQ